MTWWNQVWIFQKVETWMVPITTGYKQSTNGQLNKNMPRRDSFWLSPFFITSMIFDKTRSFRFHAQYNFRHTIKRSRRRAWVVSANQMRSECQFFKTPEHDDCQNQIRCTHQYAMLRRREISKNLILPGTTHLILNASIDYLNIRQTISRRDSIHLWREDILGLKDFDHKTVKKFYHTKNKNKINRYGDSYFAISETFVWECQCRYWD
jgi:hypothetical protein